MDSIITSSNWPGAQPAWTMKISALRENGTWEDLGRSAHPHLCFRAWKPQEYNWLGPWVSTEVLRCSVSPWSFSSLEVLYIYQLSLSPFTFSVPCTSVRTYSSSSLEEKTEAWEVTGRVRNTLPQLAVDTPFCDPSTGWECLTAAKAKAGNKNGERWREVGRFAQRRLETSPSCLFPLAFHCFPSQPQELPYRHILRYFSLQQVPFLPKVADGDTKLVPSGREPADNCDKSQGQRSSSCPLTSSRQGSCCSRQMLREVSRAESGQWDMAGI